MFTLYEYQRSVRQDFKIYYEIKDTSKKCPRMSPNSNREKPCQQSVGSTSQAAMLNIKKNYSLS